MVAAEQDMATLAKEISMGGRKNLFDELDERGFVKDVVGTKDLLRETMRVKRIKAYAGVDPTAPSLHLGHLTAFMPLFWMYLHGYGGFTLIGGSTAKVGDPTGRTESRPQLSSAELTQNLASIHFQLKAIWANVASMGPRFGWEREWAWARGIINNNAWWNKKPMLEVMRRLGADIRVGPMLGRDNVKTRLHSSGMSFSEFAYPLMQGWDWYELYKQRGISWQIGGSDQYGNILTGAECVKHCVKNEPDPALRLPFGKYDRPMGFTVPLLTDSSGAKFGKSAGNALWLDPFRTTPYDLYGYLVRRSDDEVERLLKLYTFHSLDTINTVMEEHKQDPSKRVAQHLLAHELLWLVHSKKVADETQAQHRSVYGATPSPAVPSTGLSGPVPQKPEQYQNTPDRPVEANNRPRIDLKLPRHILDNTLARIVFACGLSTSIGDADRSIKAGGLYIGGRPGGGIKHQFGQIVGQLSFTPMKTWRVEENKKFLIDDKLLIIRKGKHNIRCIELISDEEWEKSGLEYPGQPKTGAFRKAMSRLDTGIRDATALKKEVGALAEEDKVDVLAETKELNNAGRLRVKSFTKNAGQQGLIQGDKW
ncbi:tyrosyl-tRNA synthetase [Gnomoniopsis sp. IMI 355080]|nr:tyrosyl-tRNA synthetase [Gnomoniopsis sp. IMI 355080]